MEYTDTLVKIHQYQAAISQTQNLLLEKLTVVLASSTKSQESTEKLHLYFDTLILLSQKIGGLKPKIIKIIEYVRQIRLGVQQGRIVYVSLLLEHANFFKRLIHTFNNENKISPAQELMAEIKDIDKRDLLIQDIDKIICDMLKVQESIKSQIEAVNDKLSNHTELLISTVSRVKGNLHEQGSQLNEVLLNINNNRKNAAEKSQIVLQRNTEIYKYLSSMENSLRLTVANQLLDEADRAVTTVIALNYDENDFASCKRAAELGNVEAMLDLGLMYLYGEIIESNEEEGFRWVKQAADEEFSDAIYVLAGLYNRGIGTNKNDKKAFELYEKAAELGNNDAMCSLARSYLNGNGVKENHTLAFEWFKKSAETGNAEAMNMLGRCYYEGWGTDIDISKSAECYKKSAELGNYNAMSNLGLKYLYGQGVVENNYEAFKWFQRAIDTINQQGENIYELQRPLYFIGRCYQNGWGTSKNIKKAIECFRKASEAQNYDAMLSLAYMYHDGEGVYADSNEAFKLFKDVAENADDDIMKAEATNMVGMCYYKGEGHSDKKNAVKWFRKAAEAGYASAMNNLGWLYSNGDGVNESLYEAFRWFKKVAEAGDTDAMCTLGHRYLDGQGTDTNTSKAFSWFKKAAEEGNAEAMNMVGRCYYEGYGTYSNKKEAVKWYEKAAESGDSSGMYNLALMYYHGDGVSEDNYAAFKYFKMAADENHTGAYYMLGKCCQYGYGTSIDISEAINWYEKATRNDDIWAMVSLGHLYLEEGRYKNTREAFRCFKKAADLDNAEAMNMLGRCYYEGWGTYVDKSEAVKCYEKAAKAEYPMAMYNLGLMYMDGEGVSKSYYEAFWWFEKAAKLDHASAAYMVGYFYSEGLGPVYRKPEEARKWYQKAADLGDENAKEALRENYSDNDNYSGVTKNRNGTYEATTVISNRAGIHARPASVFVQKASSFRSKIQLKAKGKTVDAKSILMIMSLGLSKGTEVSIIASGSDAVAAVSELKYLIDSKFGEE